MPVRVTEVLGYFQEPWAVDWILRVGKKEANRIKREAMKIGTRVDELIKSGTPTSKKDRPEVNQAMQAYDKWKAVYQPKSIINGTRLNAIIEGVEVTGEPDLFVDDILVDIKCSSKISPSYWVQVNMYHYLELCTKFKEDAPFPLDEYKKAYHKVAILRLDKVSGSYEYVVKDYDASLVDVWVGMLRAYMYFNKEKDNDGAEL